MSKVEQGIEGEVEYQHLVPLEGYPGFYTYKDLELDEARLAQLRLQIHQIELDIMIEEMKASRPRVNLGELKLVPLEGHPGLLTYKPLDTE